MTTAHASRSGPSTPFLRTSIRLLTALVFVLLVCAAPATGHLGTALAAHEATSINDLPVALASYVGAGATSQAAALDVAPDGTVVIGGTLSRELGEAEPQAGWPAPATLIGGGDGVVLRLAPTTSGATGGGTATGYTVASATRIGGSVEDLRINNGGAIAVCGDFGIAVLDHTASQVQWLDQPGAVRRCALGEDGTVAALVGVAVNVYTPSGTLLASWGVGGSAQNDVAIDTSRGVVVATGFTNRRTSQGVPVQVAFLKGWSYHGVPLWSDYDFPVERLGWLEADTRGIRVSMGRDGKLYFAAESAGGSSIFTRQPHDIQGVLSDDQLVRTDTYTSPAYGTLTNHVTWFGRYDPANGALEAGQFILARQHDSGRVNTIRPRAITADEQGRIYLAGVTSASIQDRDRRQVGGTAVGPYAGSEAFLLVVESDLRQRLVWTTFTAPAPPGVDVTHDSTATAVAVRNGVAAVGATLSRGALLAHNALPGAAGGVLTAPPPSSGAGTATATASATVAGPTVSPTTGSTATPGTPSPAPGIPGSPTAGTVAADPGLVPSMIASPAADPGLTATIVASPTGRGAPTAAAERSAGPTGTAASTASPGGGTPTGTAPSAGAPTGTTGAAGTSTSSPTVAPASVTPAASPGGVPRPFVPPTRAYIAVWPQRSVAPAAG
ncbi:MAG TPA: hypothetical protein VHS99_05210 [Chloroflexota bacterium]|nr:hypothetical protein [Chloroflexota bacterium]